MAEAIQFAATLLNRVGGPVFEAGLKVGKVLREAYDEWKAEQEDES